jgi:phage terminase large subunit-like protein
MIKGKIDDPCTDYAYRIITKQIPSCKRIFQLCEIHLVQLNRAEKDYNWEFSLDSANRFYLFCTVIHHWKGDFANQAFELLDWQSFVTGMMFGWVHKITQLRKYKDVYLEVPRKNGKSFLAAAIGLFLLVADGEEGAEIYSVATMREQAKIVWTNACKIVKKNAELSKYVEQGWLKLEMPSTNSTFVPLASDSKKLDGLNPHGAIADELHQWEDDGLADVIEDGMGNRSQPIFFKITTAGDNINSLCYRQRIHSEALLDGYLNGMYVDHTFLPIIYTVDQEIIDENPVDFWLNPDVWYMANPSLGGAKLLSYMEEQSVKATLIPSRVKPFKIKQLNIWEDSKGGWLKMEEWDQTHLDGDKLFKLEELKGKKCYGGLDLSSVIDVTAFSMLFLDDNKEIKAVTRYYLPEDNMKERVMRDKVPWDLWVEEGRVVLTSGNAIDLDFIFKDIMDLKEIYNIVEIGFDPWKAIEISNKLHTEGIEMVLMRQGHGTLGYPTLQLEKFVLQHKFLHNNDPILRYMASNTAIIMDSNENIKPDKAKSNSRIDGIAATINALGRLLFNESLGLEKKTSVYESRGIRKL